MIKRTNDNETYTNPRIIIELMKSTIKDLGDEVFRSRKYKVLREGWIAATYAKAVSKASGRLMYIRPNPIDSLPDYYGFRILEGEEYSMGENFEIEVFEWGDFSKENLFEALKKKIEKYNSPHTLFVCYAHKAFDEVNFTQLAKQIQDLNPDILELTLIINIKGQTGNILLKLFPELGYLYIPNSFSKLFYPKYDFAKKIRAMRNIDGGLVKINSEMQITKIIDGLYIPK